MTRILEKRGLMEKPKLRKNTGKVQNLKIKPCPRPVVIDIEFVCETRQINLT